MTLGSKKVCERYNKLKLIIKLVNKEKFGGSDSSIKKYRYKNKVQIFLDQ